MHVKLFVEDAGRCKLEGLSIQETQLRAEDQSFVVPRSLSFTASRLDVLGFVEDDQIFTRPEVHPCNPDDRCKSCSMLMSLPENAMST